MVYLHETRMTIKLFDQTDQAQMELPFWDDGGDEYSGVMWCGGNRFEQAENPLARMINSFQWDSTPQENGYWNSVLGKIEILENDGIAGYDPALRRWGMGEVLVRSFTFNLTDEGHDYWYDVVLRLRRIDMAFKSRKLKLDNNGSV